MLPNIVKAQLEKVIVETYYISDANDAFDTIGDGNPLPLGSKTYRVYVDLQAGSKLLKLYGSNGHPLKFSSTKKFYNNKDRGEIFANKIAKGRLKDNTMALDSWLTLGEACSPFSGKTNNGILKNQDSDGASFLVSNNDGMLLNNDPAAGIALTSADGFIALNGTPATILLNGDFFGLNSTNDTSIFGRLRDTTAFSSTFCSLESVLGVAGAKPDSNQILVAQLTTTGDLSFELNIDVKLLDGTIKRYVASEIKPVIGDTIVSSNLKYPAACGCQDVNFLEYSNTFSCSLPSACITPLVLGCLDTNACNYNSNANFNVSDMCCYIGYCNDRNLAVVCPTVNTNRVIQRSFSLYHNQVDDFCNVEFEMEAQTNVTIEIFNAYGIKIRNLSIEAQAGKNLKQINTANLEKGLYLLRFNNDYERINKVFIKQ